MSKELRRKLRRNPTAAEKAFWRLLHPLRTDGWHFRKQVELGSYYVDFACLHAGIVIEIDGHSHGSDLARLNDETRNAYLAARGFKVLRFNNEDVFHNSEGVFLVVRAALGGRPGNLRANSPSPTLPAGGRVPAGDTGSNEDH